MNGRLLFFGLALAFVVAFGPLVVLFSETVLYYNIVGQLYLLIAEASVVLAPVGLVVVVLGALRRGSMRFSTGLALVVLSVIALVGTLASAWWTLGAASWASLDCGPSTLFKCDLVQAGSYVSLYFFPAIAIPTVTLGFGLGNTVEKEGVYSTAGLSR